MNADHDSLAGVAAVVRRTLAARTRDQHLVEDLTQETLARLADSEHRLPPDEQRAYAVVTARNLLASHYRGQSVRGRHLHRLVEHGGADDPAQVTVDKEESDALTSALSQLPTIERDLLVRHEVGGADLATLAGEANVSSGAIAMRLARARATLRLEFLLAFRRLELPTDRCRPVLLALAVGDRRRQAQIDANTHVAECPICAELLAPMTGRDRRIAGWLLIPIAEGLRRTWRALRAHPVQAAVSGALTVATTGALVVAGRSAGDDATPATTAPVIISVRPTGDAPAAPVATPSPTAPPPVAAPAVTLPAVAGTPAPPPASAPVPATDAPTTDPEPPCPPPAPLDQLDLGTAVGCPFTVSVVTVTAVSGDGLEVVTSAQQPVSVDVGGGVGLPVVLVPGVRVAIAGTVTTDSAVTASELSLAG